MLRHLHALMGAGLLCATLVGNVLAATPASEVATRLEAQNRWLTSQAKGEHWKAFLDNQTLKDQLAKGAQADPQAIASVLARYEANAPGLDRPQFMAVREALVAWQQELTTAQPPLRAPGQRVVQAPPGDPLGAARGQLQQAVANLNAYLARGGRATHEGWRHYLELPRLEEILAQPDELPDPRELEALSHNFYQNEAGIDLPQFLAVRQALRRYHDAVTVANAGDLQAASAERIAQLERDLAAYEASRSDEDAVRIGDTLRWLRAANQSPAVAQSIRQRFMMPNLYINVSQRLASVGINERVDDVGPVRELILGTDVHGMAHTTGWISLRTVPNQQRAHFEIVMNGQARSNNIGYNGPVTICSVGLTSLSGSKPVFLDANGLYTNPAVAVGRTDTTITGISARHAIIERIAWGRAQRSEAEAEAIAGQRAAARLERRMDQRSAGRLAEAQRDFHEKFRRPLIRRGAFPELLQFSTDSGSLRIVGLKAAASRLGAPGAPPRIGGGGFDLALRVHESMVGNTGEDLLAGRTLTDERLAELMEEATGEVPEELQITEDKDPWSITFASGRPVGVVFEGNTATIAIRGTRFTRNETRINRDMIISARYRLEQRGNSARLVRDGDVSAEYVGEERQSAQQIAIKTLIRRKFEAVFKPELAGEGIKLPQRWAQAGQLELRRLDAADGWLTLGWALPADGTLTAAK